MLETMSGADARFQVRLAPAIEPLLTLADVADALAVSRRVVERLKASGKLPPPDVRIGKLPRWKPATIRRWIDQQCEAGPSANRGNS